MIRTLTAALAAFMLAAPALALTADDARLCNAMAESFVPKQEAIAEQVAERDVLAARTEELGLAYELAEEQRAFSAGHAATADAARAEWESARDETLRAERGLQAAIQQLNEDVAQFNARCAG